MASLYTQVASCSNEGEGTKGCSTLVALHFTGTSGDRPIGCRTSGAPGLGSMKTRTRNLQRRRQRGRHRICADASTNTSTDNIADASMVPTTPHPLAAMGKAETPTKEAKATLQADSAAEDRRDSIVVSLLVQLAELKKRTNAELASRDQQISELNASHTAEVQALNARPVRGVVLDIVHDAVATASQMIGDIGIEELHGLFEYFVDEAIGFWEDAGIFIVQSDRLSATGGLGSDTAPQADWQAVWESFWQTDDIVQ